MHTQHAVGSRGEGGRELVDAGDLVPIPGIKDSDAVEVAVTHVPGNGGFVDAQRTNNEKQRKAKQGRQGGV